MRQFLYTWRKNLVGGGVAGVFQQAFRIHQHAEMIGIDIRRDAVTEIEHVSRAIAVTREDIRHTLLNRFGIFTQQRRVQIALQRHPIAGVPTRIGEVCSPVNAKRIAARC